MDAGTLNTISAVAQTVGAVGTVGALVYAIRSFQHEADLRAIAHLRETLTATTSAVREIDLLFGAPALRKIAEAISSELVRQYEKEGRPQDADSFYNWLDEIDEKLLDAVLEKASTTAHSTKLEITSRTEGIYREIDKLLFSFPAQSLLARSAITLCTKAALHALDHGFQKVLLQNIGPAIESGAISKPKDPTDFQQTETLLSHDLMMAGNFIAADVQKKFDASENMINILSNWVVDQKTNKLIKISRRARRVARTVKDIDFGTNTFTETIVKISEQFSNDFGAPFVDSIKLCSLEFDNNSQIRQPSSSDEER